MKNILKAIRNMIDGVYHYVDEMVRKATEANPDWDQNEPAAPDYVKNRPFWTDDPVETVLLEGTVVNNDAPGIELIVGQEYTVTLDGADYVLTAWDDGDGSVVLGSESLWLGNDYVDTEPPFVVGVGYGDSWFYTLNEGEEHTLRIVACVAEIHKIDEKYLPSTVVLTSSTIYPQCLANCVRIDKYPKIYLDTLPAVEEDPIISGNVTLETWKEFVAMMTDGRYIKFHGTRVCSNIQAIIGDIPTEVYSNAVTFEVNATYAASNCIEVITYKMRCIYSDTSQTVELFCEEKNIVQFDTVKKTTTYYNYKR